MAVRGSNFYIPFEEFFFTSFTQEGRKEAVRVYRSGIVKALDGTFFAKLKLIGFNLTGEGGERPTQVE